MGNHLVKTSLVNFPLLEAQRAQELQETPEYNYRKRQMNLELSYVREVLPLAGKVRPQVEETETADS